MVVANVVEAIETDREVGGAAATASSADPSRRRPIGGVLNADLPTAMAPSIMSHSGQPIGDFGLCVRLYGRFSPQGKFAIMSESQPTAYSIAEARESLSDLLNRVAFGGERIVLTRHGKPIAAIISASDAVLLEKMQERYAQR